MCVPPQSITNHIRHLITASPRPAERMHWSPSCMRGPADVTGWGHGPRPPVRGMGHPHPSHAERPSRSGRCWAVQIVGMHVLAPSPSRRPISLGDGLRDRALAPCSITTEGPLRSSRSVASGIGTLHSRNGKGFVLSICAERPTWLPRTLTSLPSWPVTATQVGAGTSPSAAHTGVMRRRCTHGRG